LLAVCNPLSRTLAPAVGSGDEPDDRAGRRPQARCLATAMHPGVAWLSSRTRVATAVASPGAWLPGRASLSVSPRPISRRRDNDCTGRERHPSLGALPCAARAAAQAAVKLTVPPTPRWVLSTSWGACDCGASMARRMMMMTAARPVELDARGRRLRAALAALLVPDNAPEVRLREWVSLWRRSSPAMSPRSVLLVEDDDALRGLVADTLRDAGFSVRSLPLAAQTFDALRVSTPDVIVLDLGMPSGSLQGTEVLAQLREDEVGRDIPVIIVSGLVDLVNPDVARRLGVKAILAKPLLSLDDLITTIRRIDVSP
jgi:CheY-like chemotaxis protein